MNNERDVLDLMILSLLVVSNCFWIYQIHVLLNKLASKNFYEYKFTKDGPPKVQMNIAEEEVSSIEEENSILAELNGALPKR